MYTTIPAVACQTDTLDVPEACVGSISKGCLESVKKEELTWVENGMQLLRLGYSIHS